MKIKLLLLFLAFCSLSYGQKQNIDVNLLSDIIAKKQEELKVRVLSNIVVKNIRTTNYTTYNAIYNLVDIITTEKNKTVMTQSIVRQIADYSVTYGLANYFIKKEFDPTDGGANGFKVKSDGKEIIDLLNKEFDNTKKSDEQTQEKISKPSKDLLGMNSSLLANFIIDTLYQSFAKNDFLTKKGFFKKNPDRQFFVTGLDINYSSIRNSNEFKTKVQPQLDAFITKINAIVDTTDKTITFVNDNATQFNKLKELKPESIEALLVLFDLAIDNFRLEIGKNSFIATIGDIIKKYVIFDMVEGDGEKIYSFKIDVEAIILAFEDKFYSMSITSIRKYKVGVQPFFAIGLNYGYFTNQNNVFNLNNTNKNLTQIALAGEKLGLKVVFSDYKYMRSHPPLEWYQYRGNYRRWRGPTKKPLISNFYGFVYASGLLYNVVDVKSEKDFQYAIVGSGFGLEFFNGLEVNLSYVFPVIPKSTIGEMNEKSFINFGFDIPIFEYIKAAREKRK